MKAALVELSIDPTQHPSDERRTFSAVLQHALRRAALAREQAVKAALASAVAGGADWIVFPGWTVVGTCPPPWLVDASQGRTIACECLHPDGTADKEHRAPVATGKERRAPDPTIGGAHVATAPWPSWTTYLLRDGEVRVAATQRFARANDRARGSDALITDLEAGGRSDGDAILWICGEVELLSGGGGRRGGGKNPVRNATKCEDSKLRGGGIVLNPAHTRAGPQASRDKRAWLSGDGWLLSTANRHTEGWTFWGVDKQGQFTGPYIAGASQTAAGVWRGRRRLKGKSRVSVAPIGELGGSNAITWVDMR